MTRLRQLVDNYKYITCALYTGSILIATILVIRALGYEPRVILGLTPSASADYVPPDATNTHAAHPTQKSAVYSIVPVQTSTPVVLASAPVSSATVWPLHGKVTTQFGAPDPPYQAHHTGIDISSAKPAGVMNVVAFRAGRVVPVGRGFGGYGNIVSIDHGGGLVSYYGHLYSINVSVGQQVNVGSVIGKEGSTGNSTGPHVHFEVRLNNVPVNPRNYIVGNP